MKHLSDLITVKCKEEMTTSLWKSTANQVASGPDKLLIDYLWLKNDPRGIWLNIAEQCKDNYL